VGWDKRWKAKEAVIRKAMERECCHDLAVVTERRDEPTISLAEMKRRLGGSFHEG
jgi:phosphopantetheinyl transferase (holo-ACP synthase)